MASLLPSSRLPPRGGEGKGAGSPVVVGRDAHLAGRFEMTTITLTLTIEGDGDDALNLKDALVAYMVKREENGDPLYQGIGTRSAIREE